MGKCVVFDLDGTLLDTLKDLNCACNYALRENGYPIISIEETRMFIGNGIRLLIERSLKGKLENVDKVFNDFKEYYFSHYNVYTKKYPNIDNVLAYLKNKNCVLGVLSNKNEIVLKKICDELFCDAFDIVLGDSPNRLKKPAIDGLVEISNKFNVNIEDIIYIGDSDVDVKTAINAKCRGVFVSYGFRDKKSLIDSGAKIICDSTIDLLKKLELKIQ